ncbi:hypothetical protein B6U46_03095 [Ligilactobacillus salivarius]|uniref:hypothetical protein n=1 Tax=Ligilactobacillus salivarius TaxID=1624 RepID=UPI0009F0AE0A|nr:hypothetical protein [Ligilactobacillus salivarius]OQR09283.1 hypothetical protein B6U46_03095 [Ligilactobacillus salivarius]
MKKRKLIIPIALGAVGLAYYNRKALKNEFLIYKDYYKNLSKELSQVSFASKKVLFNVMQLLDQVSVSSDTIENLLTEIDTFSQEVNKTLDSLCIFSTFSFIFL